MKKKWFVIAILIFLLLLIWGFSRGPHLRVTIDDSGATVGQPVAIEVHTSDNVHAQSADELTLTVTHQYNKDINVTTTLTSYKEGTYLYYYIPPSPGEYLVNVTGTINGEETSYNTTFVVN